MKFLSGVKAERAGDSARARAPADGIPPGKARRRARSGDPAPRGPSGPKRENAASLVLTAVVCLPDTEPRARGPGQPGAPAPEAESAGQAPTRPIRGGEGGRCPFREPPSRQRVPHPVSSHREGVDQWPECAH
jgi:hypothetical protein